MFVCLSLDLCAENGPLQMNSIEQEMTAVRNNVMADGIVGRCTVLSFVISLSLFFHVIVSRKACLTRSLFALFWLPDRTMCALEKFH